MSHQADDCFRLDIEMESRKVAKIINEFIFTHYQDHNFRQYMITGGTNSLSHIDEPFIINPVHLTVFRGRIAYARR